MKVAELSNYINSIAGDVGLRSPLDFIKAIFDIGIVSFAIFKIFRLVRETRAWQIIKGIIFILLAANISDFLGLKTIAYILNHAVQYIAIALIVLFQPELRRGLEQIGKSKFKNFLGFDVETDSIQTTTMIEQIINSVLSMSSQRIGALIVIEREIKFGEIIKSGIQLNAEVSSELIENIFAPNTPLHDGAVIIRKGILMAATCFLPLTDNPNLGKDIGTRHRAALGITEVSDAVVVVVSEETGKISVALNGGLTRNLTTDMLRKALNKTLIDKVTHNKKLILWKVKKKDAKDSI